MIRKPSPPWLVLCIDSGAVAARGSDVWMLGGLAVVACAEPALQVHSWLEKKRECCRSLRHLLQVLCIRAKKLPAIKIVATFAACGVDRHSRTSGTTGSKT